MHRCCNAMHAFDNLQMVVSLVLLMCGVDTMCC